MNIHIKTIPHKSQRYPTCGDYWEYNGTREIRVSHLKNEDYEFLIAIHEMIEQHLCLKRGISEQDITDFDVKYELARKKGDTSEPGNSKKAPYYKEHRFATKIERLIHRELLDEDWNKYNDYIDSL